MLSTVPRFPPPPAVNLFFSNKTMPDFYSTIKAPAEASLTEKRSHFYAFAYPVSSAAEAREIVKTLSKKYYDARHVCWAYMLGADRTDFLSTDNGEPSGTAGKPILGQINSLGLTNVMVAVVRYFGGIKLGTPGLIAAYKASARLVLEAAEIIEKHQMEEVAFTFPYLSMNDVMKVIKESEAEVTARDFNNACAMTLEIRQGLAPQLHAALSNVPGLSFRD